MAVDGGTDGGEDAVSDAVVFRKGQNSRNVVVRDDGAARKKVVLLQNVICQNDRREDGKAVGNVECAVVGVCKDACYFNLVAWTAAVADVT